MGYFDKYNERYMAQADSYEDEEERRRSRYFGKYENRATDDGSSMSLWQKYKADESLNNPTNHKYMTQLDVEKKYGDQLIKAPKPTETPAPTDLTAKESNKANAYNLAKLEKEANKNKVNATPSISKTEKNPLEGYEVKTKPEDLFKKEEKKNISLDALQNVNEPKKDITLDNLASVLPQKEAKEVRDAYGNKMTTYNMNQLAGDMNVEKPKATMNNLRALENEKAYNDAIVVDRAQKKIDNGQTLTPSEELTYASGKIRELSPEEQRSFAKISDAQRYMYDYQSYNRSDFWNIQRDYARPMEEARDELKSIKDKNGNAKWDDDKINNYIKLQERLTNKRLADEQNKEFEIDPNDNGWQKFFKGAKNTAYDLKVNPTKAWTGFAGTMVSKVDAPEGFGADMNNPLRYQANKAEKAVNEVNTNAIGNDHPVGQFVYNGALMGAESAEFVVIGGAIGGAVGDAAVKLGKTAEQAAKLARVASNIATLPNYGVGAFQSTYEDARNRGASENQALTEGFLSGVAEMATELVPLNSLMDIANGTKVGRNIAVNILKQFNEEGKEEAINDIVNRFSDWLVLGKDGKNQMSIDIQNYIDQGMSEEDAKVQANKDFFKNLAYDYLLGGFSGGLSGAAATPIGIMNANNVSNINNYISQKNARANIEGDSAYDNQLKADKAKYENNPTQYIVDNFKVENKEDEKTLKQLQEIADKEKSGKKLSISDRAYIAENAKIDSKFIDNLVKDENAVVPNKYRSARNESTIDEVQSKMLDAVQNKDLNLLSEAYNEGINSTDASVREETEKLVHEGMIAGRLEADGFTREQIDNSLMATQEAYRKGLVGEEVQGLTQSAQIAYNEANQLRIENEAKTTIARAENVKNAVVFDKEGKSARLTGQVTSDGFVTADNRVISIDDIDVSSESANVKALKNASEYNNVIAKQAFMDGIKDNTNIDQYSKDFKRMYQHGLEGLDYEVASKDIALNEDVKKIAFDAGVKVATAENMAEFNKALAKGLGTGKGTFTNNSSADEDTVIVAKSLGLLTDLDVDLVDEIRDSKGKVIENAQGVYLGEKGKMIIKASSAKQMVHELAHFVEQNNRQGYEDLRKAVSNVSAQLMGAQEYSAFVNHASDLYAVHYANQGMSVSDVKAKTGANVMTGEMLNDALVQIMTSEKGRDAFVKYLADNYDEAKAKSIGKTAADYVKALGKAFKKMFKGETVSQYQQFVKDNIDAYDGIAEQFIEALDVAIKNAKNGIKATPLSAEETKAIENVGIAYDAETNSAYPTEELSLASWNKSEYVKERNKAAKALAKALGVSQKKATQYIDNINSIAYIIASDKTRLDYDANEFGSSFVSNAEYGGSIDFSTICKKRLLYTGTLQAIQKQIGNRVITMEDYLDIRNAMLEDGLETTCGCCYVEGSRVKLGQFMKEFIKRYAKDNPAYVPTMYDVTMPDGIRDLRAKHPEVFEAREKFLNNRGVLHEGESNLFSSQGKPKDYTERTDYRGEILDKFLDKPEMVKEKNLNGGLRIQSFSDFEIVNLIDCMQVIMDMSRCGLAGQAYTKVKEFADALGNTGLKINLSLMGKGVDADGNLILDEVNGMKKDDAIYLRNKYSQNVGTIIVCFNDEQIKAAMKSDYIDFIIPFRRSQWRKSQYDALGLPANTRDYTMHQNDRTIKENGRLKKAERNHMPNEYWDFSKSGRENAEKYIDMCNKEHKAPKFPFLLEKDADGYHLPKGKEYDGYFKLLIDFKMYDNDGVGAPQMPVVPNFSMEECAKMLNDYTGGHDSFPVNDKIANEFAERIKNKSREFSYDGAQYSLSIKIGENEYAVSKDGNSATDDNGRVIPIISEKLFDISERGDSKEQRKLFSRKVRDYIIETLAKTNTVFVVKDNGSEIHFNSVGAREFTGSRSAYRKSDEATDIKVNLVPSFQTMIENAKYTSHEDNTEKAVPSKARGIDRYEIEFAYATDEGYDAYTGKMIVALNANGLDYFYDIVLITEEESNDTSDMPNGREANFSRSTPLEDIISSMGIDDNNYQLSLAEDDFDWFAVEEDKDSIDILSEGMNLLKGKAVDEKKIEGLAIRLRNEKGSSYPVKEFADNLKKAFAYMQSQDHVDYKTMMAIMKDIARPVIDNVTEKIGEQDYKDFVNHMKSYKIKLTPTQMDEVRNAHGKYGNYTKSMMPITISQNGTSTLDSLWNELNSYNPELFPMDTAEGDMPLVLEDALNAMRPTTVTMDEFGMDLEEMSNDLALRIIEEYVGGEVGKKAAKKLSADRAKYKAQYQQRLRDAKERLKNNSDKKYAERVARLEARNKQKAQQAKERALKIEYKKQIASQANKLTKWIDKPTVENHVPSAMVAPITNFLHALNFVEPAVKEHDDGTYSVRVYTGSHFTDGNGKRVYDYETFTGKTKQEVLDKFYDAVHNGAGSQNVQTWKNRMELIRELYSKIGGDLSNETRDVIEFVSKLDGNLGQQLSYLISNGKTNINDLSADELRIIKNVVNNIVKAVNQGNKAYTMNADINVDGNKVIDEGRKAFSAEYKKSLEKIKDFLSLDMYTPRTYFSLLGDTWTKYYKAMRNGQNTEIADTRKASKFMEDLKKNLDIKEKEVKSWTGADGSYKTIQLESGQTVRMTYSQMMSLYESSKRSGFNDRISYGGIRIDNIEYKGKVYRQNQAYKMTSNDIKNISDMLSDKQKQFADALQKYMAIECAKDGNEVTMKMYGYEMFIDPTYFPFTADSTTIAANDANLANAGVNLIKNSGFTKNMTKEAKNALVMGDILDVFTLHVAGMAKFHGYTAANTDMLRLFNFKLDNNENVKQSVINLTGSENGAKYITNMLMSINGASKQGIKPNKLKDAVASNIKASAVMGNISVVVQQPTAYFRALYMVDAKYLFSVNPAKAIKRVKTIGDISDISWWKSQGYYETSIGQSLKSIITGEGSARDKFNEIAGAPAGWADDITWAFLYEAIVKEQRAKLKGQNLSADEFQKRVNERFDDVIDGTQVVDTLLHRSQYMRADDGLAKMQTAFMAEPTKSYNMLAEAVIKDFRDSKAGKPTAKRSARAIVAFVLSGLAAAAAKSVVTTLRKRKRDDEFDEIYRQDFMSEFIGNINPLTLVPWVKDIYSIAEATITGESTSFSRYDLDAISEFGKAIPKFIEAVQPNSGYTPYGTAMIAAKPLSQLLGIPVYSVVRDSMAMISVFTGGMPNTKYATDSDFKKKMFDYVDAEKTEDKIGNTVTNALNANVSIYDQESYLGSKYRTDYRAAVESGDTETIRDIENKVIGAYEAMQMSEDDAKDTLAKWSEGKGLSYNDLYNAISNDEDIEGVVASLMEEKDPDEIVEKVLDRFGSSVEYDRATGNDSGFEARVERALKAVDGTYDYDSATEEVENAIATKQAEKELKFRKEQQKGELVEAVRNGQSVADIAKAYAELGKEYSDIKSDITKEFKQQYLDAVKANDFKTANELQRNIARARAEIDKLYKPKIAKKYNGDYYTYELNEIKGWK